MTPRKRARSRVGWPDNLYPNRNGFKYRNPITGKEKYWGTDKAAAFADAKKANALLVKPTDRVAKMLGTNKTVRDAIMVFRTDDIPHRGWKPKTAENYESVIQRIDKGIGDLNIKSLTVNICAKFVRGVTESQRGRQQFRLVLGWILACAVEEGWRKTNPALATRKHIHKRQRERLTVDAYRAIYAQAEPWLQNAMDLSLLTLLRREDVVSLRFSDNRDGALWVVPSKTEGTSAVRLKIAISDALGAILARARDDVVSPFVIHRLPGKARPSDKRAKDREHHTQVLPEQLSRAFQDARDAAGITGDNPPTFHEIRSLGGALLQDAGWDLQQVQALMGHASEEMTKVYLDGHAAPWVAVSAGIVLPTRGK